MLNFVTGDSATGEQEGGGGGVEDSSFVRRTLSNGSQDVWDVLNFDETG